LDTNSGAKLIGKSLFKATGGNVALTKQTFLRALYYGKTAIYCRNGKSLQRVSILQFLLWRVRVCEVMSQPGISQDGRTARAVNKIREIEWI